MQTVRANVQRPLAHARAAPGALRAPRGLVRSRVAAPMDVDTAIPRVDERGFTLGEVWCRRELNSSWRGASTQSAASTAMNATSCNP